LYVGEGLGYMYMPQWTSWSHCHSHSGAPAPKPQVQIHSFIFMPHKEQKFYATSSSPSTVVFLTNLLAVGHQLLFELDSGRKWGELESDPGNVAYFQDCIMFALLQRIAQCDGEIGMVNRSVRAVSIPRQNIRTSVSTKETQ